MNPLREPCAAGHLRRTLKRHKLTSAARTPVVPGEIVEYRIEILATANLFRCGHRPRQQPDDAAQNLP
jgi:predicted acyl esterase